MGTLANADYSTERALQEAAFKTFHLFYSQADRDCITSTDLKNERNDNGNKARRLKMIEDNIKLESNFIKETRRIFPEQTVNPTLSMQRSLENLASRNFIKMENMKEPYKAIPSTTNQDAMSIE